MLSALLRAGRSLTAGLSCLSSADSILLSYQILLAWRGGSVVDVSPAWGMLGQRPQRRASDLRPGAGIAPRSGRRSLAFGRQLHGAGLRLTGLGCRPWLIKKQLDFAKQMHALPLQEHEV